MSNYITPPPLQKEQNVSLESISKLANKMAYKMRNAIKKIEDINEETSILALNAAIEASAAGEAGKSFGVVAEHMGNLSNETAKMTQRMATGSMEKINELNFILSTQITNVRGNRLANLAFTNIDLIDRNLYERGADIRWWATDNSIVRALENKGSQTLKQASKRLNTILKFYSVYHDLILCDLEGNVLANGNPNFHLSGRNIRSKPWIRSALKTKNGEEYGFETVHKSPAINKQIIITFSCKVHKNGKTDEEPIGILGAVFDWASLSQTVVNQTPISESDKQESRICIIDDEGTILADSENKVLENNIEMEGLDELLAQKKNFVIKSYSGKRCCIGHAKSPGFKGYSCGWHSIIIQELF